MNLKNILDYIINWVQGINFTPVLSVIFVLAFLFLLVMYYLSGIKDRIENLTWGKKSIVYFFIALFLFSVYYVFWKAGRFDEALDNPVIQDMVQMIQNKFNSFFR